MGKLAAGMRLNVGRPMVAVRSPGGRRSITGVELLRGLPVVNVGRKKNNDENEMEKRSGRTSTSQGSRG
jgi:hypothetical protein